MSTLATNSPTSLSPADHQRLGAELTSLYHDAVEGNMRILAFGARLLEVEQVVSTCGIVNPLSCKSSKSGGGLKAWLAENAPEISIGTAWRWKDIAEATAEKFKIKNPAAIFGSDAKSLGDADRAKREKVATFVAEKSQRGLQLELGLATRAASGGDTRSAKARAEQAARGHVPSDEVPFPTPGTPYVIAADQPFFDKLDREQRLAWIQWGLRFREIAADLGDPKDSWPHLDEVTKGDVIATCEDLLRRLSARHEKLLSA